MVRQCSIKTCKSESFVGCGVSFHRLPIKEVLKQKWLDAMKNCLSNVGAPIVCSVHFRRQDYYRGKYRLKLKEDAVPSVFPVIPETEDNIQVKIEPEEEETQLANLPITVTTDPSPKFVIQISYPTPALQGQVIAEVKSEPDPIETDENPPGEEETLYFGEDQPHEDLVPLSSHPVPLSNAPDPLCDIKVKEEIDEAAAEDWMVKEEETVGVMPTGGMRPGDGRPLRVVPPPTADLFQTSNTEEKIKNLTRQSKRARARLRDVLKTLRRRDVEVSELQHRVDTLSRFVRGHHGTDVVDELVGAAARGGGLSKQKYRMMVQRRDEKISELLAEVESHGSQRVVDAPSTQIYSIKNDERMKKANRQLLIIKRDDRQKSPDIRQKSSDIPHTSDIRQKTVQNTLDNRQKWLGQGQTEILKKSLVGALNTFDIRQKSLVDAKPTFVIEENNPVSLKDTPRKSAKKTPNNPLAVMQPILESAENLSFGTPTTLEVRQNSSVVKTTSVVPQIGNKRKSEIRQNVEKRQVVSHPKLDIRQIKSSDIPHTSVGLQRTSDVQQKTLVIQIDGMQSTVIPPKLVRLEDDN